CPAVLPAVILVSDDLAGGIHASAHISEMSWAILIPAMLVPAHELDAHRAPDGLREERGGLRGILVAAAAERAGALVILHADFLDRETEHLGELRARGINVLRGGAHQSAVGSDIGDGAIGPERQVTLIGAA